jgi:hypothetical protein
VYIGLPAPAPPGAAVVAKACRSEYGDSRAHPPVIAGQRGHAPIDRACLSTLMMT